CCKIGTAKSGVPIKTILFISKPLSTLIGMAGDRFEFAIPLYASSLHNKLKFLLTRLVDSVHVYILPCIGNDSDPYFVQLAMGPALEFLSHWIDACSIAD